MVRKKNENVCKNRNQRQSYYSLLWFAQHFWNSSVQLQFQWVYLVYYMTKEHLKKKYFKMDISVGNPGTYNILHEIIINPL